MMWVFRFQSSKFANGIPSLREEVVHSRELTANVIIFAFVARCGLIIAVEDAVHLLQDFPIVAG